MGLFPSKTYNVQKEQVKTIPRNTDRPKSRSSIKSKSDAPAERDSIYIPLKPAEDATKVNNFGLNLPEYDENEAEDAVTATMDEKQVSSTKVAENSESAISKETKSTEIAPAQEENAVPEERERKLEQKSVENPDAILVLAEEPVVEATPPQKEELAERERSRSIAIENEILQAVAHIPERRDSKLVDAVKEETTKEKDHLTIQEETTSNTDEIVHSTLGINSVEEKLVQEEPNKTQLESSTESVQGHQDQSIHKSKETIEKQPEEEKPEATLEETVHLHELQFKKVEIGTPKENALEKIETKKKETIEADIRVKDSDTEDEHSKAEAAISNQHENKDTCSPQAEIKVEQEIPKEVSEQTQIKEEETNKPSSKSKINEEASEAEVKNLSKSMNEDVACERVVVQETEKQNEAIATDTAEKEENISSEVAVDNQNVINHSKDDNTEKVATEEQQQVALTEAERAEIIEEMCSKVNQVPYDESRRISLIMKDIEVKGQEKELLKNHVDEPQDQALSIKEIDDNLRQIQEIEEDIKTIKAQVIHFAGTSQNSEYLTLHETLIRNIIKLDDICVEDGDYARQERKRVIKFTQQCLNDLEGKLQKSKGSDDSDSE